MSCGQVKMARPGHSALVCVCDWCGTVVDKSAIIVGAVAAFHFCDERHEQQWRALAANKEKVTA